MSYTAYLCYDVSKGLVQYLAQLHNFLSFFLASHSPNSARVFDNGLYTVVVDDSELLSMNLDTCASIGADKHKIAYFARRAAGKAFLVFISIWADFHHEEDW
jgi:hypothetical protein